MATTIVRLRPLLSTANDGWMCRLYELGKGYRLSSRTVSFGRVEHIIKRGECAITLTQGRDTAIKTSLKDLTSTQAEILGDLESIGMLAR